MSILLSGSEVFSMAMEIEKSGYAFYKTVAGTSGSEPLKQLFTFLAEQEIQHYEFFEKLSKENAEFDINEDDWEEISDYIRATTESRFFIGEDKAINLAKSVSDPEEAIDIAIGFEKDTLLFFYELLNVTPEASKNAAQQIVEEEKRHIRLLSEKKHAFLGE